VLQGAFSSRGWGVGRGWGSRALRPTAIFSFSTRAMRTTLLLLSAAAVAAAIDDAEANIAGCAALLTALSNAAAPSSSSSSSSSTSSSSAEVFASACWDTLGMSGVAADAARVFSPQTTSGASGSSAPLTLTRLLARLLFHTPASIPPSARLLNDLAFPAAARARSALAGYILAEPGSGAAALDAVLGSFGEPSSSSPSSPSSHTQEDLAAAERLLDALGWRQMDAGWAREAAAARADRAAGRSAPRAPRKGAPAGAAAAAAEHADSASAAAAAEARAGEMAFVFGSIRALASSMRRRDVDEVLALIASGGPAVAHLVSRTVPRAVEELTRRLRKEGALAPARTAAEVAEAAAAVKKPATPAPTPMPTPVVRTPAPEEEEEEEDEEEEPWTGRGDTGRPSLQSYRLEGGQEL
jgi:hypothetical protein